MAQRTPSPVSLREAVETVVDQNKSIGYNPTRFTRMTQGGYADNLVEVCDRLIRRGETYEAVSDQLENHPDILTLEDLIVHSPHGREWGLAESAIEMAKARVEAWDIKGGLQRWSPPPEVRPELV